MCNILYYIFVFNVQDIFLFLCALNNMIVVLVHIVTWFPSNIGLKRPSQKYIFPEIRVNIFLHFGRKLSMCKYKTGYRNFWRLKKVMPFYINHGYCTLLGMTILSYENHCNLTKYILICDQSSCFYFYNLARRKNNLFSIVPLL